MKVYVKAAGHHNKNTTSYDVITLQMLSDNDGTLTLDNGYVIKNCEPNWMVRHPYTTVFVPQEDAEYIFSTPESILISPVQLFKHATRVFLSLVYKNPLSTI